MSKTFLIIVSGPPCSGKTTLARKISREYCLLLISRDDLKESLFDSLGFSDREWSKKLGNASYALLYKLADVLLGANTTLIVESNFNPAFDNERFLDLFHRHDFELIELRCIADGNILFERFSQRAKSSERHPGHIDSENLEEFKSALLTPNLEQLNITDKVFDINTSDFTQVDYQAIYSFIDTATNFALRATALHSR